MNPYFSFNRSLKLTSFLLIVSLFVGCSGGGSYSSSNYSTNYSTATTTPPETETAEKGLDLQAVTELAKKAKSAEDFEKLLNQPDSVNNIDLDEDGKVDYINVTEYKDSTQNAKGFSLSVDLGEGNIQEIATIMLERDGPKDETIDVYVAGNEEIYGTDDYYAGSWDYDDSPFSSWAYSSHSYYRSPYRYGVYPAAFTAFAVAGLVAYRSRIKNYKDSSPLKSVTTIASKSKLTSPNAGKSASNIKATLAKPTTAQQVFQKSNPSRASKTTSSSSTSSRSSSSYPSSSSPSRSSSSYPSSSSSSSSSRSSSSSSRSSSRRR